MVIRDGEAAGLEAAGREESRLRPVGIEHGQTIGLLLIIRGRDDHRAVGVDVHVPDRTGIAIGKSNRRAKRETTVASVNPQDGIDIAEFEKTPVAGIRNPAAPRSRGTPIAPRAAEPQQRAPGR